MLPKRIFPIFISIVLAGCAVNQIEFLPPQIVATVTSSVYTGWARNWCSDGEPVKGDREESRPRCLQHGGELYRLRLSNIRSCTGEAISGTTFVLAASHGPRIPWYAPESWYFALKSASSDLALDTGAAYLAVMYERNTQSCVTPVDIEYKGVGYDQNRWSDIENYDLIYEIAPEVEN